MRALDVRGLSAISARISRRAQGVLTAALLVIAIAPGCASGTSGDDEDSGGARFDANRDARVGDANADAPSVDANRDAPPSDAPPVDAHGDGGGMICSGTLCTGFTHCVAGRCEDYPMCRGDGTCATAGDICIARRCVPGTVDIDGDGSPAAMDCDETNPMRSPLATETCNMVDDDCDMMIDDGDAAALCAGSASGGICIMGTCGCPPDSFDIDRAMPGCECTAAPVAAMGAMCGSAIDLGSVSDAGAGATLTAMGNALPEGREVWYHFTAVDSPDTACDNFNVRVHFTVNPGMAYDFTVRQGTCVAPIVCAAAGDSFQDFTMATNFRMDVGGTLAGECPCTPPGGAVVAGVSACSDNGGEYYVRVRRLPGAALSCSAYTLEVSNGI
jgi:hypothetical protein